MFDEQSVAHHFHAQGYNDLVRAPDHKTILWGGCQASVLLFLLRSFTKNNSLSMLDIASMAEMCGVGFFDIKYATKISYAAIPLIAKFALPNHKVAFYHTATLDEIDAQKPTNYFGEEAKRVYLSMAGDPNTHYGASEEEQIEAIKRTMRSSGAAIPLLHTNTLYQSSNSKRNLLIKLAGGISQSLKKTDSLHAVALTGTDIHDNITVVDPEPGYLNTPWLALLDSISLLRVKTGKLSYVHAQAYAKNHHPYKSVVYPVTPDLLGSALRWCTVTINPRPISQH